MFRSRILIRYVLLELLRVFLLSLVVITAIFVLLIVVGEAVKQDLTLRQITRVVPMVIPVTLPYTIPATALFAASAVFGRLSADNEIMALKASGVNPLTVVWPAWVLGAALGLSCYFLLNEAIPRVRLQLQMQAPEEMAEYVYARLQREKSLQARQSPYSIVVEDVKGRRLINPRFMKLSYDRRANRVGPPELVVQAREAFLRFDLANGQVLVDMKDALVSRGTNEQSVFVKEETFPVSLPALYMGPRRPKEMTDQQLQEYLAWISRAEQERRHQMVAWAAFQMVRGCWQEMPVVDMAYLLKWVEELREKHREALAEIEYRRAVAASPLTFAILGVPVAILFQRRDFLSAFGACFLPIIAIYYPLVISAKRLATEGTLSTLPLWAGNILLVVLSLPFYRRILLR